MKQIDININCAKILSYNVGLREEKEPYVCATVGLFSGTKQISTFSLHTKDWYSSGIQFDLPPDIVQPIVDIAQQLEIVLVRECNRALKRLPKSQAIENDS